MDMEAEIRDLLSSTPFEPFRIHTTGGQTCDITDPGGTVMLKNRLFVAFARRERWTFIPYLHIASIESLRNGRSTKSSRSRSRR
jgi:hypothetical protein